MKHEEKRTEMNKILGKGDTSAVKGVVLDRGNLHSSKLSLQSVVVSISLSTLAQSVGVCKGMFWRYLDFRGGLGLQK